jgi:hypothetical protein
MNCSNIFKIFKYIRKFTDIPDYHKESVLNLLGRSFFTKERLNKLNDIKLLGKTYNFYFGHIPLYILYDQNKTIKCITWNEMNHTNFEYISSYRISDDSLVIIKSTRLEVDNYYDGIIGPIIRL